MKLRITVLFAFAALLVVFNRSNGQVASLPPGAVVASGPSSGSGDGYGDQICRPEAIGQSRALELEQVLGLTTVQTRQIAAISIQEAADCQALGPSPSSTAIRQRARDQIRALLTPEQRAKFNLMPERVGGGLTGKSPWEQRDRLDKLVHLTPAQKQPVLDELIDRTENLMENQGPEKTAKAQEIRSVMNAEIRALLTPEQQKILDASLVKRREKSSKSDNS